MVRIGMLTPSSNTVLEPVSSRMIAGLDDVSLHFARFKVTEIALSGSALGQFDDAPMLAAAELLSHAKVDVICWNGTSAGWLGLDADRRLCARITEATGTRATSCVLTLFEVLRARGAKTLGLVTPYTDDVQARIIENFGKEGVDCSIETHLGIRDNFSFATVGEERIEAMVAEVAARKPDAICVFCTNLVGGLKAAEWEARFGVPVHDSVALSLYGALKAAGVDTARVEGFGSLFAG